jgi:hypothetical protein
MAGMLMVRTPLHHTRLLKLLLGSILLILNCAIKVVSGEKITIGDKMKWALLLIPVVIQTLLVYGFLTLTFEVPILIITYLIPVHLNLIAEHLKCPIKKMLMLNGGSSYQIGKFNPEDKCILPAKDKLINTMDNNSGNNNNDNKGNSGEKPREFEHSHYDPVSDTLIKRKVQVRGGEAPWQRAERAKLAQAQANEATDTAGIRKRSSEDTPLYKRLNDTQNLIDALNSNPNWGITRPSTSMDRSSSDLGEGTSKPRRPNTAPEASDHKVKDKKKKGKTVEILKGILDKIHIKKK